MPYKTRVIYLGREFRSIQERDRWIKLSENKEISHLVYKPKFPIIVNGITITTYIPSFSYKDKDMNYVVEHFRGTGSSFKKIAKLMLACYGITINRY